MEKLFNCEILDRPAHSRGVKEEEERWGAAGVADDEDGQSLALHNFLDYTELYRKYKEKNGIKGVNKLPVSPYRYPPKLKNPNFDEIKTEYIYDKINAHFAGEKLGKSTAEGRENNQKWYEGDLKIWIPQNEQERQKKVKEKKSLRKKIYDGEVMFYEDYVEQQVAKDYERFFKKPYQVKKKDEGGKYYLYGKKLDMNEHEDIYRKYYNLDDEFFIRRMQLNEEINKKKEKNVKEEKKEEEEKKKFQKEYEKLSFKDQEFIVKLKEENNFESYLSTYKFYKKNKNIFEQDLPEIKKKELLFGQIPDIILPANVRKTKHPKNCLVPLSSLHTYAKFIDDLFKCPYIYTAIDAELGKYWKTNEKEVMNNIKSEKIKKGYKKDIYSVTKEQLESSSAKLRNLLKSEDTEGKKAANININFKIPKKENKMKTVCNGRYVV
ncbi:conserved Plasmodium protein, unknown function [Plasmodium knowlesi strain H]|uniref:Apical exonemal protein n=3 Tax=Plasmodium knowlesi TaxID=5850 RepID=A0A5K1VCX9_PLAKH|nr:apical exonemal protein, putative [Plasmodium knowlesi strain H]OTN64961.1 Uncharacterized protein PKNOH_S120154100 [Plasmodium knowlesi]CAA9988397.1 apical exonemal protein, putative [Plasmodium knowlesi strain H]SBO19948.1 conserved Plasmodium protein, unknown function [Plasmodium knowlesi strain H]SBO20369.1 conserved Plasmodium protein, unknown function [Plasmodium knowlesi strain H]VVS77871.1 apical exonemal protein, putative [Plasmodium knowlesi strain H]|eukprot:XP_002259378.1 hypothetical protein, conserved in Plasmodium species [Plasmodium knowlesi strain H]